MNKLLKGLVCLSAGAVLACSSCSIHQHGTAAMEDLVGVYKLTTLTVRDEENNDVNAIERDHVDCYLCITGEKFGYAYYKDDNVNEKLESIYIKYKIDEEETTESKIMYSEIEYEWGYDTGNYPGFKGYHPGFNEAELGVNSKTHKLSYWNSKKDYGVIRQDYVSVCYERLTDKHTFADFAEKIGKTLTEPTPFLFKKMTKTLSADTSMIKNMFGGSYDRANIILNDDLAGFKIQTLATGVEDISTNYVESEEYAFTLTELPMPEGSTWAKYELTTNKQTVLGEGQFFISNNLGSAPTLINFGNEDVSLGFYPIYY